MNSETVAIIPARGGSKGVKRKNVRLLGGKPLIAWTIEAAKSAACITRVVVSTEDDEIKAVSESYGVSVVKRPIALARDDSTSFSVVEHCIGSLGVEGYAADYLVLLQPTSPFRTAGWIDKALTSFMAARASFDSLLSVTENEYPPFLLREIAADGNLRSFIDLNKMNVSRRQDYKRVYRLNGAIYIIAPEVLIKNRGFETDDSMAFVMDRLSSLDIDEEEDLLYAEYLLSRNIMDSFNL